MSNDVGPFVVAALRFSFALMLVYLWAKVEKVDLRYRNGDFWLVLPLVCLFVIQIFMFNAAAKYTTSARVGVILNSYPFWVALLSGLFFKEDKLTVKKLVGASVAITGVLAIFQESFFGQQLLFKGDVLVFFSSWMLTGIILVQKWILKHDIHPTKILIYEFLLSIPIFVVAAFIFDNPLAFEPSGINMLSLIYQGVVVGGVVFIAWQLLLKRYSPARLSSFFFLVPVFAVLFGYLFLQEALTSGLWIGLGLISTGVYFVNR